MLFARRRGAYGQHASSGPLASLVGSGILSGRSGHCGRREATPPRRRPNARMQLVQRFRQIRR
jgi:hypothetical protein